MLILNKLNSKNPIKIFRMMGIFIARAILDERIIDFPLNKVFWDLVLNRNVTLKDIELMNPNLYR